MTSKHIGILVLAVGLGVAVYRSSTAASGSACLASAFIMPSSSVQQIANTNGKSQPAPPWELKDLDGKAVKLSDFKGKVVILNFWATWCPPCRQEIPSFISLQKQYGDKGLVVVGVSLDDKGPGVVKPFVAKMGINYPVVMGDQKTTAEYGGVAVIPTTFVIDRKGRIAAQHEGDADRTTFESEIKPLLAQTNANL